MTVIIFFALHSLLCLFQHDKREDLTFMLLFFLYFFRLFIFVKHGMEVHYNFKKCAGICLFNDIIWRASFIHKFISLWKWVKKNPRCRCYQVFRRHLHYFYEIFSKTFQRNEINHVYNFRNKVKSVNIRFEIYFNSGNKGTFLEFPMKKRTFFS